MAAQVKHDKQGNLPEGILDGVLTPSHAFIKEKDLPPVIRQLMATAPEKFKIPTFVACMAPLGCMATRLRFKYTFDQDPHAPLLQVIIVAEQSGGKGFARRIEDIILKPLKVRDMELRRIEQKYRELKQTQAKNKKLPDPPLTDVRTCPASISIAQIVKRADTFMRKYGEPLTLWLWAEELAAATDSNKRAFSNLQTISRVAYDLGSFFGVDYLSDNSYSANVDIIYCSLFCATPSALDDFMSKRQVEGGNVTRTIVCDLDNQLGDDAPEFKPITPQQKEEIDRILQAMMDDTYADEDKLQPENWIDISFLDKTVRKWCSEKNLEALKTGSNSLGVFFKRSSVSAFRCTSICYYLYKLEQDTSKLTDTTIEKRCKQIYLFMADYILNGMLQKWGGIYDELVSKRTNVTRQTTSIFDQLPKEFTRDQLHELVVKLNLSTPVRVFLSKWTGRKLISRIDSNHFVKI